MLVDDGCSSGDGRWRRPRLAARRAAHDPGAARRPARPARRRRSAPCSSAPRSIGQVFYRGAVVALAGRAPPAVTDGLHDAGPQGADPAGPHRRSPATTRSASGTSSSATPPTRRCRRRSAPSCTSASPTGSSADAASARVEFDEIVGYHLEQALRYRGELGRSGGGRSAPSQARAAERLAPAARSAANARTRRPVRGASTCSPGRSAVLPSASEHGGARLGARRARRARSCRAGELGPAPRPCPGRLRWRLHAPSGTAGDRTARGAASAGRTPGVQSVSSRDPRGVGRDGLRSVADRVIPLLEELDGDLGDSAEAWFLTREADASRRHIASMSRCAGSGGGARAARSSTPAGPRDKPRWRQPASRSGLAANAALLRADAGPPSRLARLDSIRAEGSPIRSTVTMACDSVPGGSGSLARGHRAVRGRSRGHRWRQLTSSGVPLRHRRSFGVGVRLGARGRRSGPSRDGDAARLRPARCRPVRRGTSRPWRITSPKRWRAKVATRSAPLTESARSSATEDDMRRRSAGGRAGDDPCPASEVELAERLAPARPSGSQSGPTPWCRRATLGSLWRTCCWRRGRTPRHPRSSSRPSTATERKGTTVLVARVEALLAAPA